MIKLDFTPEKAYAVLTKGSQKSYIEFRDASIGQPYTVSLLDCLKAVKKALDCGYFDFDNFDFFEYEHYEVKTTERYTGWTSLTLGKGIDDSIQSERPLWHNSNKSGRPVYNSDKTYEWLV